MRKIYRKEHVLHRGWHGGRRHRRPLVNDNRFLHARLGWRYLLGEEQVEEVLLLLLDLLVARPRQVDRLIKERKFHLKSCFLF